MLDTNKDIFWFGSCGSLVEQSYPIQMDLAKHMPDLFGEQGHEGLNPDEKQQFTPYILGSQ